MEGFFDVYGFSINDSPSYIYNTILDDYDEHTYSDEKDYTYKIYSNYSSFYESPIDVFSLAYIFSEIDFVNAWNVQFAWQIEKNNQVNTLTQQNTSLNNQLVSKDEEIAFKQQQIEAANRNYLILSNQFDDLNSAYNTLSDDYDSLELEWGKLYERYLVAESEGYTRALNDYNAFENGLFSIFNAPFVFVQNIVGFEIFGITLIEILMFFLIIGVAFLLIKFIGGALPL